LKTTGHRIARTADGKHVLWGHEGAAFLAYVETDEVPDEVLKEVYPEPEARKPEATKPRRAKETK
jgi:hypothetical protein